MNKDFKYEIYDIYDVSYEDDNMLHIKADAFLFVWDINEHGDFKFLWDMGFKPTKIIMFFICNTRYWEIIEWKESNICANLKEKSF